MAVSIIVACHGPLAAALKTSAEMICGPLRNVSAIVLEPDDSPEEFQVRLEAAVDAIAGPVLVLADLMGGTPHNVAALVLHGRAHAVLVSGVSLGLLIEAATSLRAVDEPAIADLVARGRDALSAWHPPAVGGVARGMDTP